MGTPPRDKGISPDCVETMFAILAESKRASARMSFLQFLLGPHALARAQRQRFYDHGLSFRRAGHRGAVDDAHVADTGGSRESHVYLDPRGKTHRV
jgi:hypothetical protein